MVHHNLGVHTWSLILTCLLLCSPYLADSKLAAAESKICLASCVSLCLHKHPDVTVNQCILNCPMVDTCANVTFSPTFAVSNLSYEQPVPSRVDLSWNITFAAEDLGLKNSLKSPPIFVAQFRQRKSEEWEPADQWILDNYVSLTKIGACSEFHIKLIPIVGSAFGKAAEIVIPEPRLPWIKLHQSDVEMKSSDEFLAHFKYEVPKGWNELIEAVEVEGFGPRDLCKDSLHFSKVDVASQSFTGSTTSRHCEQHVFVTGYTMCKRYIGKESDLLKVKIRCTDLQGCTPQCNETHLCRLNFAWSNLTELAKDCTDTVSFNITWEPPSAVGKDLASYKACKTKFYTLNFTLLDPDFRNSHKNPISVEYQGAKDIKERREISLSDVPVNSILRLDGCQIFEGISEEEEKRHLHDHRWISQHQDINLYKFWDPKFCAQKLIDRHQFNPVIVIVPLLIALAILLCVIAMIWRKRLKDQKALKILKEMEVQTRNNPRSTPPSGESDHYELDPRYLQIYYEDVLGQGAFGKVYKGKVLSKLLLSKKLVSPDTRSENEPDDPDKICVAVKVCHEYSDDPTKDDFRREITLMKQLYYHPTLVNILHCVTQHEPLSLVVEYCANGDLLAFLRSTIRVYMKDKDVANLTLDTEELDKNKVLTYKDALYIAFQVSDGMQYMTEKGFIHRDLAARNILVSEPIPRVKIGDFGLCRHVNAGAYVTNGGKLPIKWMALESLKIYQFTPETDVWSFAILLYEIVTLGDSPYPEIVPEGDLRQTMIEFLSSGSRMGRPENCSEPMFELISKMWDSEPENRPKFSELKEQFRQMLEDILGNETGYYGDYYIAPANTTSGKEGDNSADSFGRVRKLNEKEMIDLPTQQDPGQSLALPSAENFSTVPKNGSNPAKSHFFRRYPAIEIEESV